MNQIIKDCIEIAKKRHLPIGNVACHPSDKITRILVSYEDDGETAVLSWSDVTRRWPASEVFDPNDVKALALDRIFATRG